MLAVVCIFLFAGYGENVQAKIKLTRKQIIVEKGRQYNIASLIKKKKNIVYKSKNKAIAPVNKKGILKARENGTVKVTIKKRGKKKAATLSVKVTSECSNYTLKNKKTISLKKVLLANQETVGLNAGSYKWISKNRKIVKTVKNGKYIKAKKKGTTYLEGVSKKKKEVKVLLKITVGTPVSKIKLSGAECTMSVNSVRKLDYEIVPSYASNKKVVFEVSDESVIAVSETGVITAKKTGESIVTVRSKDGHATAEIKITVNAELVRDTIYGKVEGIVANQACVSWLGVPYAKPPVGELRWRAPKAPEAWTGILSVKEQKNKAAQALTTTTAAGSEDCLYLNIFRPNTDSNNLPVLVYLHGGSNISGSSAKNFRQLSASANAVIVSVEYRLGAFGWFNTDALKTGNPEEDSGNYAMLDIKQSLKWVQDNIAYFGGNPNNVTLSGFSAGARNALAAVISPVMKGLFHKAIIFSGGMTTYNPEDAEKSAIEKLADILVKRKTYETKTEAIKWINNASKEELKSFLYGLTTDEVACMYTYMGLKMSNAPQLFEDGYVIPKDGFDVLATGNYNVVPMIFGSVSQEFSTYALGATYIDDKFNTEIYKKGWNMLEMIQAAKQYGSMYQSYYYVEHNTEKFFASGNQALYAYRFDWGNNKNIVSDFHATFLGSYHGMDVNFLCGIYKNEYENYVSDLYTDDNLPGRKALTGTMQSYIANFLQSGNPNGYGLATWNTWSPHQAAKIMVFNASKKENTSILSSMYYKREEIDSVMKASLSADHVEILNKLVFAGRFFMPEDEDAKTPDDEAGELVEIQPET